MEGSVIDRIAAHINAAGIRLPVASEQAVGAAETALGFRAELASSEMTQPALAVNQTL